jgi:O-antigen/teichoic acid export membrane protein
MSRPASVAGEFQTDSSVQSPHSADSPSIWRRIRRDVVLLGAGSMATVFAQLIFRSILIAVLIPAGYGRLSLVLSIYNTVWIIGASGLPNGVARYIAIIAPADDSAIVRSAFWAGAWPTLLAASFVASASAAILDSPLAFLYGAVGLSCIVYSFIINGVLRGRGQMGLATMILPLGGVGEVGLLAILVTAGLGVTPVSAFGVFCLGNVIGLVAGILFLIRTDPRRSSSAESSAENNTLAAPPTTRQLLGFSVWLGAATVGIVILPLVVRLAAALNSYTVVAIVDVALVLLSIPLRMGSVIVGAAVPHATRALSTGGANMTISRREQWIVIVPFVLAAMFVAFTPTIGWLFDSLGRPEYAKSSVYLALALLAGPARVLYGLVEGVLVAHGESRFLAYNSLSITALASVAIIFAATLGSMVTAFALFVVACWSVYFFGLRRVRRLTATDKTMTA